MDRRRLGWRACYELLASRVRRPEWAFMNYGYAPSETDPPLVLDPADEADRLCIGLYARTLAGVGLGGRDVLEVGSGRGGGAAWIARTHRPRTTTGLDFSAAAVDLSSRHRHGPGLSFVRGDAEAMPFDDAGFDVVVNVESSHCYGSVPRFLSEVRRVLRPGGTLVWADFRGADAVRATLDHLRSSGMELTEQDDVTARVVAALRADDARKAALIDAWLPRVAHPLVRRFAAMEGSRGFEAFAAGRTRYLVARLEKPVAARTAG